jgi:small GTP-binding protein
MSSSPSARVKAIVDQLGHLADALDQPAVKVRARDEAAKLASEEFNLAIVGEFNRGKSTLLNALIGVNLLPVAIIPLTSIVTLVENGPEPIATVEFSGGESRVVAVDRLGDYVTERDNPGNAKRVQRVSVRIPSTQLRSGFRLIDTPGIGSVLESNTATTLQLLPELDAAIFVLTATDPLTKIELEFLDRVRLYLDKLFFVLNKIDVLSPAELEQSLDFCARTLKEVLGSSNVRLYPLSARAELEARLCRGEPSRNLTNLAALERDLAYCIETQRDMVLLSGTRRRLSACIDEAACIVDLRRQASRMSLTNLDEQIGNFQRHSEHAIWSGAAVGGLLSDATQQLGRHLESTHEAYVAAHRTELVMRIERASNSGVRRRRDLIRLLNHTMAEEIERLFAMWAAEQAQFIQHEVAALVDRLEAHVAAIVKEVSHLVEQLFGIRIAPWVNVPPFSIDPPRAQVDRVFSLMLEDIPLLLPGPLARRIIRRSFARAAPAELARNLSRAVTTFDKRLREAQRLYRFEFQEQVASMLRSLNDALDRCRRDRGRTQTETSAVADELDGYSNILHALRSELQNLS